ncbi:MAG: glycosyltransferase family 4 protein [Candidatus Hydrogenedentes bacterium]|nr:glycosyltransferase family 4 protein [Candidatus Hydrogenedentota bacterium]
MRVGIDVGPITRVRTGVGNYCYYLLKHLVEIAEDCEMVGFASGTGPIDLAELRGKIRARSIRIPTRILYKSWSWFRFPQIETLIGAVDVYHATNYFLPPVKRARRVVTIHDLAFLAIPERCSPKIVGPFSRYIHRFAQDADAILAYSQSTKDDIVKFLAAAAEKVVVAPMAVDENFRPVSRDRAVEVLKRRFDIEPPFLLFVSTLEPRKNVPTLLRAFHRLAKDIPHRLVLVGSVGWKADEIFETIARLHLENRIVRLGFVPHLELPVFYGAADAFVFPTCYEGFGLPLLEALACGCPVVTAANSSVPEVCGDAAQYVDAMDDEGLASAVRRVLEDEGLRAKMVASGHAHAAKFSWKTCARSTLDLYRSLAQC